MTVLNSPKSPVEVSLLPAGAKRSHADRLFDGRLVVHTSHGLHPLNRLLIEGAAEATARRILGVQLPDAVPLLAVGLLRAASGEPCAVVAYYHLDLYHAEGAREAARRNGFEVLESLCVPDVPVFAEPPELVLFAFGQRSETALVCEVVRQSHARMALGGHFLAAVQNPKDTWLRRQIERVFGNLSVLRKEKDGLLYSAKKKGEGTDETGHFVREIEVAFASESFRFESSYGVFCNGGLDEGSRALLDVLEPPDPCRAILDLGCGWGPLGILASRRWAPERLTLTDANARAADLARRNAERHARAGRVDVRLECDGAGAEAGAYDLVVCNPPYSTEFRATAAFVGAAHRALRPGGTAWFVTKSNPLLEERLRALFGQVRVVARRGYCVSVATRRANAQRGPAKGR